MKNTPQVFRTQDGGLVADFCKGDGPCCIMACSCEYAAGDLTPATPEEAATFWRGMQEAAAQAIIEFERDL